MNRRKFLKAAATVATVGALPTPLLASVGNRSVRIFEPHRGEVQTFEYWVSGWYNPDVLSRVDSMLRDWRTGEVRAIDPALLDLIYVVQERATTSEPLHVISGYRSPSTNAMLRRSNPGVASNSYHIRGQAADIRLPGYNLRGLRDIAMDLQAGGVGYYPRSNFVHVDTGPVRTW